MSKSTLNRLLVSLPAGDEVYAEGESGATMFIVQSGSVELYREIAGSVRSYGELEKGDFFGEMSVLEGAPRATSARVLEDAELIEINSTTFDRMLRGNTEIAVRLLRKLSLRLREAERRLEDFEQQRVRPIAAAAPATKATTASPKAAPTSGVRLEEEDSGRSFPIRGDETMIGRFDPVTESRPDVDLTEFDLKRSVSRRHARLLRTGEAYSLVEEVGALNGTFVNGERLVTGKPHPVATGDTIGIGILKFVFCD